MNNFWNTVPISNCCCIIKNHILSHKRIEINALNSDIPKVLKSKSEWLNSLSGTINNTHTVMVDRAQGIYFPFWLIIWSIHLAPFLSCCTDLFYRMRKTIKIMRYCFALFRVTITLHNAETLHNTTWLFFLHSILKKVV